METGLDNRLSELQRENTVYWVHWRPVQTAEQQDWTHRTLALLQNYIQKLQRKHLFLFLHHLWFPTHFLTSSSSLIGLSLSSSV